MKQTSRFCLLALALTLTACSPTQATRGNIVEDHRMQGLQMGVSSKTDVLRAMGSPTTQAPFDENIWYYIGQKTEKRGILDPEVVEEKIVVAAFNQDGILSQLEEIDNERIDIPTERDKTPTSGKEVTFMQQLLGNVGRFNKSQQTIGGPGPSGN